MAILENTQQLVQDALFRAGEVPGASEWDSKALDYINREYRALCSGASEFLPEYVNDWWWMRSSGILTILPTFQSGTVDVTQDSTSITFSIAPSVALSLEGYFFRVNDHPDVFKIASHVAGATSATLDSPFTGLGNDAAGFQAAKLTYSLDSSVSALMSPIKSYRDNHQILGLAPERMDALFPLGRYQMTGVPQAFSLEDERTIRFSHGGLNDGMSMRMEYRYRPAVVDLENTALSVPLVPLQFRHVLSDMALVYLYTDKNDDRLVTIGTSVRSTLGAMTRDNKRRHLKIDQRFAQISPRARSNSRGDFYASYSGTTGGVGGSGDIDVLVP